MTTLRATARFENEVLRSRSLVIGAALAAIVVGVTTFALGLRQPTETRVGDATFELHTR